MAPTVRQPSARMTVVPPRRQGPAPRGRKPFRDTTPLILAGIAIAGLPLFAFSARTGRVTTRELQREGSRRVDRARNLLCARTPQPHFEREPGSATGLAFRIDLPAPMAIDRPGRIHTARILTPNPRRHPDIVLIASPLRI